MKQYNEAEYVFGKMCRDIDDDDCARANDRWLDVWDRDHATAETILLMVVRKYGRDVSDRIGENQPHQERDFKEYRGMADTDEEAAQ